MSKFLYEQRMRLKYNMHAYQKVYKRLEKAIENNDDHEVYAAIGKLLLWVITTHEWHKVHGEKDYEKRRNSNDKGLIISGLLHAYNSIKHNMELFTIHYKKGGFSFSDFSFSEFDFRPYSDGG